jgi:hypothetical protein
MAGWNVLLRDHHPGYVSWEQYEANQTGMTAGTSVSQVLINRNGRPTSIGPSG